jgi:4-hydroxyphenylpyruvate dioxygenase
MRIQNQGFDHVEFVVNDLARHEDIYRRMGFERVGARELRARGLKSTLWAQGFVRILLTEVDLAKAPDTDPRARFLREHGEGICTLAVDVDSAESAYKLTTSKGARSAMEPKVWESTEGSVTRAEVFTPADVRYAFIERKSKTATGTALFDEELVADRLMSPSPFNLRVVDHLTNNVDMGEMPRWVDYYKKVWDFKVVRHFDISTGRTGLTSDVVQSDNRKICVPINQATEPESQVQEFVERFHGAGVQHLALLTTDIVTTLKELRKNGFKFLAVPHTYYEEVPRRVTKFDEDLRELEDLGILLDGEGGGYLLQIFSEEMVGPFFYEFIQRKGNEGFGEGNFKALFQAIERDQIKRGVLK